MTAAPPAIASWTKPSDIYTLTVKKGGTTYGLESGFVFFEYFESIFSPIVTGNVSFIDTGFGINQGTITNALQISGNEEVEVVEDKENTAAAKAFWQHTGLGLSSREAAIALGKEAKPSIADESPPLAEFTKQ